MATTSDRPAGQDDEAARRVACAHCGERSATCVGAYDNMEAPEPACDECCGHGCEDGRCTPLNDHEAVVNEIALHRLLREGHDEADRAAAHGRTTEAK